MSMKVSHYVATCIAVLLLSVCCQLAASLGNVQRDAEHAASKQNEIIKVRFFQATNTLSRKETPAKTQ